MKRLQLEDVADLIYRYRPNDTFTKDEVIAQMHRWHASVRVFKKGEILLKAGTRATHFLMLLEGTVQRRLPTPLGEDIVLGFSHPGDFFGMPAVFKPEPPHHPVDVVAHEKGIAVFFDTARLRAARRDPTLMPLFEYLAYLTAKLLVEARAHAMILTGTTIAERLRRYFSIQIMKTGSRTITVPSNEAEFAQHLGVNKCALSRTLNQLRAQGKISYRRNVITVLRNGVLGLVAALFLAGCASIERTSPGVMDFFDVMGGETKAETTVVSRNFGFCLFYLFTVICGDLTYNRDTHGIEGGCLFFRDMCNTSNCYLTLRDLAEDEGKDLTNVSMVNNSLPFQGIDGYVQILGWLFEAEDASCSGVLRAPARKTEVTK